MLVLAGVTTFSSYADRGVGKKKGKVLLNIKTTGNSFQQDIAYNLKSGLKYSGSILTNTKAGGFSSGNVLVTYQKGNSIYIMPYKQKVVMSDIQPGYTGMKLVIKAP
ncbi:MAG: hypothetical protein KF829_00800 [Ferruginibacter sp.]|nr:hypothetical protein [Ferruginibacter sp.]